MARLPKSDFARLARIAKDHLELAKMLRASLETRIKEGMREAAKNKMTWQPDDSWRADFDKVSSTITQMTSAMTKALEADAKAKAEMTTEQLEVQFKSEMIRSAASFTAEDWAMLDRVRMKQTMQTLRSPSKEKTDGQ